MKRVTGIGGIFFKSIAPKNLKKWYAERLGIFFPNEYGGIFEWRAVDDPEVVGHTTFGIFREDTSYFEPSEQPFMVNYRVENLEALLKVLESEGVEIIGDMESYEYGKFAWILDPEGNKIELWEPKDKPYRKINGLPEK